MKVFEKKYGDWFKFWGGRDGRRRRLDDGQRRCENTFNGSCRPFMHGLFNCD